MKLITLPRSVVIDAAKSRGVSACEEINRLLTASLGFEVCSHFIREDVAADKAVFSFARKCVPTSRGGRTAKARA